MDLFIAKLVYGGDGSSVSFGRSLSFAELCEKIRSRFPQLQKVGLVLKFNVHPDTTIFTLDNEVDMITLFRVLDRYRSDFVDISIHDAALVITPEVEPINIKGDGRSGSGMIGTNSYLGCFRREESRFYMSNNWRNNIVEKGQIFEGGVKEFRIKLRMYAIGMGFHYSLKLNRSNRVIAICEKNSSQGCTWTVKASLVRHNDFFVIYMLQNEHQCASVVRMQHSKMVTSDLVKEVVLDKVRENPNTTAIQIQKELKLNYGLDIPYHKAWYGKELARASVIGDEAESYRQLQWFGKRTTDANPDSRVDVQCDIISESPTKRRFERMFVSYGALLNGFQFCRPVLHIDATFITSKYRGMLLAATAKDANNGLYLVAYAIVDSETERNWTYFFQHISECLSKYPERKITFISDRNIGLLSAVRKVFPNSHLGFCYRHLEANLTKKYPANSYLSEKIPNLFMRCAYSRTREYFDINMRELRHHGGKTVDVFLRDLPYETWASCYFNGDRCGEMTNNLAESFNSWIKDIKNLPIVELNEAIRVKTMSVIAKRKIQGAEWKTILCPNAEKRLIENLGLGKHWPVQRSDINVFEVQCQKSSVTVNLEKYSCSCGEWEVNNFPCSHALLAIQAQGSDIYSYVNPIFQVDKYRSTYAFTINPVSTISKPFEMTVDEVDIDPPLTKRPAGRPKVNRYKSKSELKRIVKCGRCKKIAGHNKKTCKEVI